MFVVMRLIKWDSMELKSVPPYHLPFPVEYADREDGMIGFLPVFETREQAEAWAEDGKYPIMGVEAKSKRRWQDEQA